MIPHYSLLLVIAHERQQELLRQAEVERLHKQLKRNRPALLQQVAHHWLTAVQQLTVYSQSNRATSIFGER